MNDAILATWKNIGNFMQVSKETAKRRYKKGGLPVYYVNGRPQALASEILDWMKRQPKTPAR